MAEKTSLLSLAYPLHSARRQNAIPATINPSAVAVDYPLAFRFATSKMISWLDLLPRLRPRLRPHPHLCPRQRLSLLLISSFLAFRITLQGSESPKNLLTSQSATFLRLSHLQQTNSATARAATQPLFLTFSTASNKAQSPYSTEVIITKTISRSHKNTSSTLTHPWAHPSNHTFSTNAIQTRACTEAT